MTHNTSASRLNLPTKVITAEELHQSIPKLPPLRRVKHGPPPPPELMAELRTLLRQLNPDRPSEKFGWYQVLQIIWHETACHPDGLALADAWSRRGRNYQGAAAVKKAWDSIKPCRKDPLTIRTLRWMVEQKAESNSQQ